MSKHGSAQAGYRPESAARGSRRKAPGRPRATRSAGGKLKPAKTAERLRSRASVHANTAPYRAVIEDLTEVISRFQADGRFTFVNEAYCRFFGRTRKQLLGRRWQPRAVAEDVPLVEAKLSTLSPANPVVVIEN